ncbi:MAG: Holliday junction branch migration protein RuvA [Candidatus Latescibacterota bacterium]
MISYLQGTLIQKHPTHVILDVGGVGFALHISLSSYNQIGEVGARTQLLSYLHVREDALELFGFTTEEERALFLMLISVSGIGPKLAQGILSSVSPAEFQSAIVRENITSLTALRGIGRKTAQRLIVELKDRFEKIALSEGIPRVPEASGKMSSVEQAFLALLSLGFKEMEAQRALDRIVREEGRECPTEELVKKALTGGA